MASIYRRAASRYWWAKITTVKGPKRFSTKQTDHNDALAVATAAEREIRLRRPGLHSTLAELANKFAPVALPSPAEYLRLWLGNKAGEVSPSTHTRYASAIASIVPHLNPQLTVLNKPHLLALRDSLAGNYSPSTVNHAFKILRMALEEAVQDGLLAHNPAKAIRPLRTGQCARRPFTSAELCTLLRKAPPDWRAMILLGVVTGQRIGDLSSLRWAAVNFERRTLTLRAKKTGRHMEIPLPDLVLDALRAQPSPLASDLPVFPRLDALTLPARSNSFRSLLFKCRLATDPRATTASRGKLHNVQPLSFHSLRHTATTLLKAGGASSAMAQTIIGHASAAISANYTHLDAETLRPAIDALAADLQSAMQA